MGLLRFRDAHPGKTELEVGKGEAEAGWALGQCTWAFGERKNSEGQPQVRDPPAFPGERPELASSFTGCWVHTCLRGSGDRKSPEGEKRSHEHWRGLQTSEGRRGGIKLPEEIRSPHIPRGPPPKCLSGVFCFFISELR